MKKRFIEWNLPMNEISKLSVREKNIHHGHPSTLHIWWARRPLASSRATNFASLIDLPEDKDKREEIKNILEKISSWDAVKNGNDKNILKAQKIIQKQWDDPPKTLDPFSGGGSIPLESLRLGCETYALDYNPVAVFIEKATLEWPQKYGIRLPHPNKKKDFDGRTSEVNILNFMLEKWSKKILEEAKKEINEYYPKESDGSIPSSYIWARTIPCQNPNCNAQIPLIRQFWLSKKKNHEISYKLKVEKNSKKINFELDYGYTTNFDPSSGTIARGNAICPICKQITDVKKIRRLAQEKKLGQRLVAVVLYHPEKKGKKYRIATNEDLKTYEKAEKYLKKKLEKWSWIEYPLPNEKLPPVGTLGFRVQRYGMNQWYNLFNSRQNLSLVTFLEKIKLSYNEILNDCISLNLDRYGIKCEDFAKVICGYLAIGLGRMSDRNSTLCVWNNIAQKTEHTFGRQALPMTWDYSEINVFGNQGWDLQFSYTLSPVSWLSETDWPTSAEIHQSSATNLPFPDNYFDAVFTDPPYYDNVPYADLSDYFYVWLKRAIGDLFPDLFSTPLTPKKKEAIAEPMRQKNSYSFFENMLSKSFEEIYRVLKPQGISTIVYAHKTTDGWETLLNSLIKVGLVVTASWPIHTERSGRLRGQHSAALASSIYMVCRKTPREDVGFYNEIQPQIKDKIEAKLQQFWNEGITGGDFFISAIGPGMEIFSRYKRVEKISGDKVNTSEFLDYIRRVSTDFIVNKLLKDASSAKIDNESEFYLAYRWTYLDNTVLYDDARKLASASGVNLEKLWDSKGFVKKSGSKISVHGPKDRDKIEKPKSMVDVMHKAVLLWEQGEKEQLTRLLADTGYGKDPAFKQFCQAVAESLLNGNKEKQLLEGFLIGIDVYSKGKSKVGRDQTDLKQFGGS